MCLLVYKLPSYVSMVAVFTTCYTGHVLSAKSGSRAESHALSPGQETIVFSQVGPGGYEYFHILSDHDEPVGTVSSSLLKITLRSIAPGDADLYLSFTNREPSFEIEEHDMQSTTCGEDDIVVSVEDVERARGVGGMGGAGGVVAYVGVYGHPSHRNNSRYAIYTQLLPDTRYRGDHAHTAHTTHTTHTVTTTSSQQQSMDEQFNELSTHDYADIFGDAPPDSEQSSAKHYFHLLWTVLEFTLQLLIDILL